jgi:hypothetical protein
MRARIHHFEQYAMILKGEIEDGSRSIESSAAKVDEIAIPARTTMPKHTRNIRKSILGRVWSNSIRVNPVPRRDCIPVFLHLRVEHEKNLFHAGA